MPATALVLNAPAGDWVYQAACKGRWDVMEDEPGQDVTEAKRVCRGCPVLVSCRAWVLSLPPAGDVDGVAGGMTAEERVLARRRARRSAPRQRQEVKECARCHVTKPVGAFYQRPAREGGRDAYCRPCCAARARERRAQGAVAS